ncbi:phosphoserine phosphatase SerB [Dichotomicrobium thermohalophilum]|uniref:Phosphoserine phosphatase n=1 Tax=Dichotomicrobium thermohalophilum TaxID=933063 RepID=A0A397QCN9_9HYPH|nr:phosphoserine phosphatase SerB [Dichotomicrobium thermohalophilum]RIA56021.1 phosphoserine phosphatase [Dichotomicrobium thermohalophilum]
MSYVLVLMAPAPGDDVAALVEAARATLTGAGEVRWLAPGKAAEIPLPDAPAERLATWHEQMAELIDEQSVDYAILPAENRRKRLLIADMDSTIIGQECLDEVAGAVGIKPQVAAITERAMRGELNFEDALRERIGLLLGLPEASLADVLETRITLNPGARELVGTMRANGAVTILVSGGFTFFTGDVAGRAGFDTHRGNVLLFDDGKLTGVAEPILGREAKRETLLQQARAHNIPLDDVLAVGDGANDLAMLELAGLGVAYHAKPVVAAQADTSIRHCDLTALLYLQGYAQDAFTTG